MTKSDQDGREADGEATQDIADKAANSYTKEFLFHQSDENRRILQIVNEALGAWRRYLRTVLRMPGGSPAKAAGSGPWARHCIECQEKQDQGILNI